MRKKQDGKSRTEKAGETDSLSEIDFSLSRIKICKIYCFK